MRARVALGFAMAACVLFALTRPVVAQTTTTSSTTTTTVDPAVVASRAASALSLPSPEIRMSPDAARDQVVNLPTWLWVEPRHPQRSSRTEGPTSVEVTASIVSVRFDTGDGETLTCPGGGSSYDLSRSESAQRSTCTHTWRRSSAAAPGGTYRVTATVTWGLGWSGGSLGTRQATASIDVRVAEAQSLDRPPAPLPGQTITGGTPEVGTNAGAGGGPGGTGRGNGEPEGQDKPGKPSLWDRVKGAAGDAWDRTFDFGRDVVDGTVDAGKGLWEFAGLVGRIVHPANAIFDFDDWKEAVGQLGDGLWHTITHPWELVGGDDIANGQPGRAVPDILLFFLPIKGVKGVKGAKGAEGAVAATPKVARLPQDIGVNPKAPAPLPLRRPVGGNAIQNQVVQQHIADLQARGARDIRVNQQQVNINGERVGVNRPDLQYTLNGKRYYEEYDVPSSNRGPGHKQRIEANDPNGEVILNTVP